MQEWYVQLTLSDTVHICAAFLLMAVIQSNFDGSNIFGTMDICSRYGKFESLKVNDSASSGGIMGTVLD